jgi:hypothetical protein
VTEMKCSAEIVEFSETFTGRSSNRSSNLSNSAFCVVIFENVLYF